MSQSSHSRRREKPVLSCSFCRGRKLRCDRQSPCGACLRRGKSAECLYSCSEQERKDAIDYRPHNGGQQARQRVARLEKLVIQMRDQMGATEQTSRHTSGGSARRSLPDHVSTPFAPHDGYVADSVGKLSLTDDHAAVYTGSTHWDTVLDEIQSLKNELSDDFSDFASGRGSTLFDDDSMIGPPASRISLLSSYPSLPQEQILAMMPARKVVDRHVSHFFNTFDFASSILHRDKFLAEYSNFWESPSATSIMWVGLLFSVMTISAFLQQQDVGALSPYAAETQETLETYRTLTIHCLVAGDYLQPNRYTIETLTLHFAVDQNIIHDASIGNCKYKYPALFPNVRGIFSSQDMLMKTGILIGVIVRIALRMGLHRDPSHWPNIRPLEAEFRRRLWITLYHMDFFTSTQVGLPRIIKDSQCDTRLPAHLLDNDLSSEHDEMPPERSLADPTPLLHIIQRHVIIEVAAEIYDATEAGPPSSATIAALGAKLAKAVDSIPEQSKYRPLETTIADRPVTILHRMFIDILIHKAVYLLHRRSFIKGFVKEETMKSSKICINAALAILEHQRRLSEECQPGGIMFNIRWKVASSLNHEFLQATMMLCFALNRFEEGHAGSRESCALPRRDEILNALMIAKSLWEKQADQSLEARKAGMAITAVLKQDFIKSGSSTSMASGAEEAGMSHDQFGAVGHPAGFFEQDYLADFDFGQNFNMAPSFPVDNADLTAFGVMWDDFLPGSGNGNQA